MRALCVWRKPMAERERKTEFLGLKVSVRERMVLERAARKVGAKNLSRYLRSKLLGTRSRTAQAVQTR